jgi:hypothetical protein
MTLGRRNQEIVDGTRATKKVAGGVRGEGEDEQDYNDHDRVDIISQEGGLDTTEHGVEHDTNGQEETGCSCGDSGERCDWIDFVSRVITFVCNSSIHTNGCTSSEKHRGDEDVGHEAEKDVDAVSDGTISSTNGFEAGHRLLAKHVQSE